jgi:hypothetical protein
MLSLWAGFLVLVNVALWIAVLVTGWLALGQRDLRVSLTIVFALCTVVSFVEVGKRSLRLWRVFREGAWIIRNHGRGDIVRVAEQPSRFWFWTCVEAVFLVGAIAITAFLIWVLFWGRNPS